MQKIIGILSVGIVAIIVAFWWHNRSITPEKTPATAPAEVESTKKVKVIVTFYPLEAFATAVGGKHVEVRSIVPPGAEPHDYEPTAQDILAAYDADIFLLNGAGVDVWAEKIRPELEGRGVKVIQMSELVSLLQATHADENEEVGHEESFYDPHFWLDPVFAQEEIKSIANALIEKDNADANYFTKRKESYLKELNALDMAYKTGLKQCKQDTVITSHNAFAYLGKRYNFQTVSISGISPEVEPTARRMSELASLIKTKGIHYIFFETLVSPKVSETLAHETGAETLVFNPLEGLTDEERSAGKDYLSIMKENLANLKIALECQK